MEEDGECAGELLLADQLAKPQETNQSSSMNLPITLAHSGVDHFSPSLHDGSSESSSLFDNQSSPLSILLEHMSSLLHRMSQADALTLIGRLKRQHLQGAHVKHLSRTVIGSITSDITQLRSQFRAYLVDEKTSLLCTRRELRALFKLFKDVFEEMAQMRTMLNEITIDQVEKKSSESMGSSWIAPISKFLGTSLYDLGSQSTSTPSLQENRQIRAVPKLGPALAASTTTVNVEFSGVGASRTVTNVYSAPSVESVEDDGKVLGLNTTQMPTAAASGSHNVMGIFAGAPRQEDTADPWLLVPPAPRRVKSTNFRSDASEQSSTPSGAAGYAAHLLRGIDAAADAGCAGNDGVSEADDIAGPLPPVRSLHRRGRSDSSISSTFANHAKKSVAAVDLLGSTPWGPSVMTTISRTMQSFKQVASHTISGVTQVVTVPSLSVTGDATSKPSGGPVPQSKPVNSPSPSFSSLNPSSTRLSPSQHSSQHHFGRLCEEMNIWPHE